MSRFLAAAVAAAMLVCATVAGAQDTRIITFQEAMRIALEQNGTLRQAENAAALGQVNVTAAKQQFLPDLQLDVRGSENYGRNFDTDVGRIVDQSTTNAAIGLSSGVVLFNGFGNTANLKQAEFSRDASTLDLQRSRETTAFTVATNYLVLISQQEQLQVQRENLASQAALAQQIQTYVDAGARTIADLYQQQAIVAAAKLTVVNGERSTQLAEVDLMQTLQLDPRGTYEFQAPAFGSLYPATTEIGLEKLQDRAYAQRADLVAGKARVDAAGQAVRVARSGFWPTVSLSAGYDSAYTSAADLPFSDQIDQRRGGSIGLGFSIPIFDRGSTAAAARRAEIQKQDAQIDLDSLQNDVGLQVRRAYLDLQSAHEQLAAAQAQLKAAELALKAAQDRYDAGASTLVELTQARATQVDGASAVVTARYNEMFQRTLIGYYIGALDPGKLSGQTQ
ncbi:MAG TPA: TolC family protein [Steroidobacteraceae bacterium]|nr:TolC family protein [Steroidobacteraceae bacterium]